MLTELATGDITAVIADNEPHPELDGHKAGYNGVAKLTHVKRRENLFVPHYAGLNLELYFDGKQSPRPELFEPRSASMQLTRHSDTSATLHQPPTPVWQMESRTTFTVRAPHYIDFEYRASPAKQTSRTGWIGAFWASYIDHPEDLALQFPAVSAGGERWVRHYSPVHGVESTHRHPRETRDIVAPKGQSMYMYASYSPWRYARSFYAGFSHGMMYLFMVEDSPAVRFTQSPSGAGRGCPAWDCQLIMDDPVPGKEYTLRARVAYKPYAGRSDIEAEYQQWCRLLDDRGHAQR